jgi:hypothetical protein
VSYKWVHSDGSPGTSGTIKVPAGTAQTVSDMVTATSDNYSATDTLEVTAAAAPAPPPKTVTLTVTCTYPQRTVSSPNITPAGTVGSPYPGATFTASGSEPPYTWSLSVAPGQNGLPAGMSINQPGTIIGTPASLGTCPAPPYRCTFTVNVSDSEDHPQTSSLPWTIYPPQQLSISMPLSGPGAPTAGTVGSSYTFTFTAIGGVSPYT